MYLYRFAMKKIPFGHTPDTDLFCQTKTHVEALNVLQFAISSGEAFCKIVGEVGCGKTMLCRMLIRKLENNRKLAYIPNPKLSVRSLHYALAKELGLRINASSREDQIATSIQNRLIKLNKRHGPVILIIDEAQAMSDETLEALRLFTNIETEQQKLLQIVFFAQPEIETKLRQTNLRQLRQRITFSYQLKKLSIRQVHKYIQLRLNKVSVGSVVKIHLITSFLVSLFSKGTPRLVNVLCHKALLLGYANNTKQITAINIIRAARDTDSTQSTATKLLKLFVTLSVVGVSSTAFAYFGGF